MEDVQIIALYYARNENAICETDKKYGVFCQRIALNLLRIREDAEECVADTYHAAWNSIPPAYPVSLRAFLGRIVRNLSIDRFRKENAQKRNSAMTVLLSELEDCLPAREDVELTFERHELAKIISDWLSTLSADDRTVFVKRYWSGEAVNTLAKKYGCTQGQMAQRMLRLRKSLKATLEKEGVAI